MIMKRSIFLFCLFLFLTFNVANSAADHEDILNKVKNQLEGVHNYTADMTIIKPTQELVYKARVFYKNGDYRVEMISPDSVVYLSKNDNKYVLNDKTGIFEYAPFVSSDFFTQELVGSVIYTIDNLKYIRDKKLVSVGENYRVICRTIINTIVLDIDKNTFTIQKVTSYMDGEKGTECVFEYQKIGEIYFPITKKFTNLNLSRFNIIVKIENPKLNYDMSALLFSVPL